MKNISFLQKILLIFTFFSLLSFSITFFYTRSVSFLPPFTNSASYYSEEVFIDWDRPKTLNTPDIFTSGVITVHFTNLISSYSNVTFDAPDNDRYEWSPPPSDFTLQPGEQYTETFNLTRGVESGGFLSFGAAVPFVEGNNATILFGYNIIFSGTKPAFIPFGMIVLSFSATTLLLFRRRKHGRN